MLKNKDLIKLAGLLLSTGLIGCNGGSSSNHSLKAAQSVQEQFKLPIIKKMQLVPNSDLSKLNFGEIKAGQEKCDRYCVQVSSIPSAIYAKGSGSKNYWVEPNIIGTIHIRTKSTFKSKSFGVSEIYNMLPDNNQIAGKITQIDDSECKELFSKTVEPNNGCNIKFTYQGVSQDSSTKNTIHFKLNNDGEYFDYSFDVQNKNISEAPFDKKDSPILNLNSQGSTSFVKVQPGTGLEDADIFFQRQIDDQFVLTNVGTAEIRGQNDWENPTINIGFNNLEAKPDIQLQNTDGLVTTCGSDDIYPGDNCSYTFLASQRKNQDEQLKSAFGNMVFSYQISSGTSAITSLSINYMTPTIISVGDIIPQNYELHGDSAATAKIQLKLASISNSGAIRYDTSLSDLKFQLKYNPAFVIGSSIYKAKHMLIYGYGDNIPFKTGNINPADVNIKFDSACFENPDLSGFTDLRRNRTECQAEITLKQIQSGAPVALQLYATYKSATEDRNVEQYVGNITYDTNGNVLPTGSYQNSCNIDTSQFNNSNILSGECKTDGYNPKYRNTSLNTSDCAPGSTILNKNGVLICNDFKDKLGPYGFNLPKGDYLYDHYVSKSSVLTDGLNCPTISYYPPFLHAACRTASGLGTRQNILNLDKPGCNSLKLAADGSLSCEY